MIRRGEEGSLHIVETNASPSTLNPSPLCEGFLPLLTEEGKEALT